MRPTAQDHSSFRHPLDDVLGRVSFVRILRVLAHAHRPLVQAEVARRARLDPGGVGRSLKQLESLGIVRRRSSGNQVEVEIADDHPLAGVLQALFQTERHRHEQFAQRLLSLLRARTPPLQAAWLQGPVAAEQDEPGDEAVLGLLAPTDQVDQLADTIQNEADQLGGKFGLRMEVRPYSRADLEIAAEDVLDGPVQPLTGPAPSDFLTTREGGDVALRSHEELEEMSVQRAEMIARRLLDEPELVEQARRQVERWLDQGRGQRQSLEEWRNLLETQSVTQLADLLTAGTERARRLRQSNPFLGILSEEERRNLWQRSAGEEQDRGPR